MITLSKLQSYLGQLIDLKSGHLSEIVIKPGEHADELATIIQKEIKEREELDQMDRDFMRAEKEKAEEIKREIEKINKMNAEGAADDEEAAKEAEEFKAEYAEEAARAKE